MSAIFFYDILMKSKKRITKTIILGGKMDWTKEQKQAIEENGTNILVAAAARKWKDSCTC